MGVLCGGSQLVWVILAAGFKSALQGDKHRCRETAEKRHLDMGDGSSHGEKWSAPRTYLKGNTGGTC